MLLIHLAWYPAGFARQADTAEAAPAKHQQVTDKARVRQERKAKARVLASHSPQAPHFLFPAGMQL